MKESQIQKSCLDWLKDNGYFAYKNHVGAIRIGGRNLPNPAKGSPDIIAIRDAIFYGIEVKKPGGRLSSDQIRWHEEARAKGGAVILTVYSLQDMIDQLMGW